MGPQRTRTSTAIMITVFIALLIFSQMRITIIPSPSTAVLLKPHFTSSFIQNWYSKNWDQKRWLQEFEMLQNVGINEVIIQDVADLKNMHALYPTRIPGYTHNDNDMVATSLTAADFMGMKIRVGLGFNNDWWHKNATDMTWLNNEAATNKLIVNEIMAMYGSHPSLAGWYIPYEFSQCTAPTRIDLLNLNSFYKQIANEINLLSDHNIMVAPFFNSTSDQQKGGLSWSSMLKNILSGTSIDIIALQDSVGVGYNTISQLANIYASTKIGTTGMQLYADIETFASTPSGNVPAPQSRIIDQFSAVMPYVKGFVAFSFERFQNGNTYSQFSNYNDYYNYYSLMNRR